jgi:hypothetical protein
VLREGRNPGIRKLSEIRQPARRVAEALQAFDAEPIGETEEQIARGL